MLERNGRHSIHKGAVRGICDEIATGLVMHDCN